MSGTVSPSHIGEATTRSATSPLETPSPAPVASDAASSTGQGRDSDHRRWDGHWPIRGREAGQLVAALAVVIGCFGLLGLIYTDWMAPNAITRFDDRVANAAVDTRTAFLTDAAPWVAFPADSYTKITISALICLFLLWRFRRWYEALYVALPLVFEAAAFITTTYIVQRDRPAVERLLQSEVATSYPSGHVAAATVYTAVAILVFRHTRAVWARTLAAVVAILIPLGVAWVRVYQGMHFLTDVTAGVMLGIVSLLVTHHVLKPHEPDDLEPLGRRETVETTSF